MDYVSFDLSVPRWWNMTGIWICVRGHTGILWKWFYQESKIESQKPVLTENIIECSWCLKLKTKVIIDELVKLYSLARFWFILKHYEISATNLRAQGTTTLQVSKPYYSPYLWHKMLLVCTYCFSIITSLAQKKNVVQYVLVKYKISVIEKVENGW